MIHKIYSNNPSFKSVNFKAGVNIILADKKEKSSKKDSRNGVGKTTLMHIMHFCLGRDKPDHLPKVTKQNDWIFFMEMTLFDSKVIISRSVYNFKKILIQGDYKKLPIQPSYNSKDNNYYYDLNQWKDILLQGLFGLVLDTSTKEKDKKNKQKIFPSFRILISYFIRNGAQAYIDPFKYGKMQTALQLEVNNAFLLGIPWEHINNIKKLKDKEELLSARKKIIKEIDTSQLHPQIVSLENDIIKDEEGLTNFKVHNQYKQLQEHSNELTNKIHQLADDIFTISQKLKKYNQAIEEEREPININIEELYNQANIHFSNNITKTLNEVREFHNQIIKNRKSFLESIISTLTVEHHTKTIELDKLKDKRADLLSVLNTHGALEEYNNLHNRLTKKKQQLDQLKSYYSDECKLNQDKRSFNLQKAELENNIAFKYNDSEAQRTEAISIFNKNSEALYKNSGSLIISLGDRWPSYKFDVDIPRSNSDGVNKMKIFCYDLMLLEMFGKDRKINFLVHDSTMFDGVDSRQVALAIEHAQKKSLEYGLQYICFFNSDTLPPKDLFSESFDFKQLIRLTLKDHTPEDTLCGLSF